MKLPPEYQENMQELLGSEYEDYLASLTQPRLYGLRVNTAKISVQEFLQITPWPLKKIPWIENGFYYDGEKYQPSRHPYYYAGLYYLQEPSAMTPADRLPVNPGERVLDLCAAPGGKATELGAKLCGEGILAANDLSSSRTKGLLKNLELFGIGNILVLSEAPEKLSGFFPEYFDKILVDAPCSGEGMFRKDPKMIRAWTKEKPAEYSVIQRKILLEAEKMLAPGGMLMYSTCTFSPIEDEQTVSYIRKVCPSLKLIPMKGYADFSPGMPHAADGADLELKKAVRIFPHRMNGEGHFLALFQKDGAARKRYPPTVGYTGGESAAREETAVGQGKTSKIARSGRQNPHRGCSREDSAAIPPALGTFLNHVNRRFSPERMDVHGGKVYYMPEAVPRLAGVRFARTGLYLGEFKKDRFEPSQALAMNLKKEEYDAVLDLSADDVRVQKYLKGETLLVEDKVKPADAGWYLVCTDGYPLGFGKLSGGMLKNKYLPGWRIQ